VTHAESLLLSEINSQPAVVERFLTRESAHAGEIAAALRGRDIRHVVIAARGTSDNAARYAQYVFGAVNRLPVGLATPSLYSIYKTPPRLDSALVVGISQSGQSPDIVSVLAEARKQGAPTVAITNMADSPLAQSADHALLLHADLERSVAATKTYTSSLAAVALLALAFSGASLPGDLSLAPGVMRAALEAAPAVHEAADRLADRGHAVVIGRGFNYATANEIALKIKELAYVEAEPYSSADFRHGPIALIETGFPVIMVDIGDTMRNELVALRVELRRRGAQVVWLHDRHASPEGGVHEYPVGIPGGLPEWLTPLAAVLPGQLLAYHLARARGFDPDQPRTIQKVTLTH